MTQRKKRKNEWKEIIKINETKKKKEGIRKPNYKWLATFLTLTTNTNQFTATTTHRTIQMLRHASEMRLIKFNLGMKLAPILYWKSQQPLPLRH